ncbi:hypothetical protein ACGFMK_23750 [Amycolatopsis sp. NPDC049252]|uniref:hypothetical protein n=1 Tax=Amycolatopsis sp. NPDC049252 TaxID=3363933 RepID=UPI003720FEB5
MTSYSVLASRRRFSVLATWPGMYSDHTQKVTTLDDGDMAGDLAAYLTHLSEGAWDAAPWLDTHPVIEAGITELISQLRGPQDTIPQISLAGTGYRHVSQWSFYDVTDMLHSCLPDVLPQLSRAQRLTVADELTADAAGRAEALRVLPFPREPADRASRAWQVLEVTRALGNGRSGPLPDGAAGWLVGAWGSDRSLAERWAARDRLTRIEQLVAACRKTGGHASAKAYPDPCAHLEVPRGAAATEDDVFWVVAPSGHRHRQETSPFEPMVITRSDRSGLQSDVVAFLRPGDDEGFVKALGEWTLSVPWSPVRVPTTFAEGIPCT